MVIQNFKDLDAWQESHKLVLEVYECTKSFPKEEIFGLTNQLRRAVVSITSNIAEGFSRQSYKEKIQFYSMALGSLTEAQNQILISKDICYIDDKRYQFLEDMAIKSHKIINGLIKSCKVHVANPNS
jgi:four helix bundle protein